MRKSDGQERRVISETISKKYPNLLVTSSRVTVIVSFSRTKNDFSINNTTTLSSLPTKRIPGNGAKCGLGLWCRGFPVHGLSDQWSFEIEEVIFVSQTVGRAVGRSRACQIRARSFFSTIASGRSAGRRANSLKQGVEQPTKAPPCGHLVVPLVGMR